VVAVARGYSSLEYDVTTGTRGSRHAHVSGLLRQILGAEAACVVNNGAAAVLLAVSELASGREVVISRGELVEIGGSFRIPDVLRAAGARLREVGTTNKTHLADYERAIGPDTALLLKVHRSNFAMVGFTAEVALADLVDLAHRRGLPAVFDLGSGTLVARGGEPTLAQAAGAGVDVVTFSGDKLLGGPQAGVLAGRQELIVRMSKHPLMRALRPGKMTLAALAATLELYRDGAAAELPIQRMLDEPDEHLQARAERLRAAAAAVAPWLELSVERVHSAVGGGALPLAEPASYAVTLRAPGLDRDASWIEARLRGGDPPVIGRIESGMVLLDVRTVCDDDIGEITRAIAGTGTE
jgi:L-seryl-tRNA(Ser) seleniumtransferase